MPNCSSENINDPVDSYSIKRNSKDNILNWKTRLTHEEIQRIRNKTKDIYPEYYTDEEW